MQFEYGKVLQRLMMPGVVSAIGDVREHRGRQELYKSLQPAVLDRLCEVAKIQSTGASNRIENIIDLRGPPARVDGAKGQAREPR